MTDLVLPLKAEFFHAIKSGAKRLEYRRTTTYWRKRLEGREFDRIILTLGYPKREDAERRIELPWRGLSVMQITHPLFGAAAVEVFAIRVEADR